MNKIEKETLMKVLADCQDCLPIIMGGVVSLCPAQHSVNGEALRRIRDANAIIGWLRNQIAEIVVEPDPRSAVTTKIELLM